MKRFCAVIVFSICIFFLCANETNLRTVKAENAGLAFRADISAERTDQSKIIGQLHITNYSGRIAEYGNFQLFLTANGTEVPTYLKSDIKGSQFDTALTALNPNDSLTFFVEWDLDEKIDFNDAQFGLRYIDTIQTRND
jgi:hypothetical protein